MEDLELFARHQLLSLPSLLGWRNIWTPPYLCSFLLCSIHSSSNLVNNHRGESVKPLTYSKGPFNITYFQGGSRGGTEAKCSCIRSELFSNGLEYNNKICLLRSLSEGVCRHQYVLKLKNVRIWSEGLGFSNFQKILKFKNFLIIPNFCFDASP